MSYLLCLAKLRRNLVLCKTPQETLLNTSVFGSSVEWKRTCSAFFTRTVDGSAPLKRW